MTVWVEKFNNEYSDDWTFAAYIGFTNMGYIVQSYHKVEKIHYKKGDIVVGCIQSMRFMANKLNVTLPNLYIPEGLEPYTGRLIHKSSIGEVMNGIKEKMPIFIKPVLTKQFPAQVITSLPLITYIGQDYEDSMECWVSTVVNFTSEYRLFIHNKQIVGCKHYWGDFRISLDWKVVDEAMSKLQWQPCGWCLDFGVTDKGETLLIEANDGYSIGNYGLDGMDYAKLLRDRWYELVNKSCL
jgi:hypothetical protein